MDTTSDATPVEGPVSPPPAEELRLALALSGGVSLAIWIGGAVAEIDRLRRADPAPTSPPPADHDVAPQARAHHGGFWPALLDLAGHQRVSVDVLAGASAGGLNSVLFAASQTRGFPYDAIRDVWMRLASTQRLVRTTGPFQSLFKGDAYFLTELRKALADLSARAATDGAAVDGAAVDGAAGPVTAVEARLAATLVEPIERPVPGAPGEASLTDRRYETGFVFRRTPFGFIRDDLPASGAGADALLWQLAVAGRASSSYPAAFEAAAVRSARPDAFGTPDLPVQLPTPPFDVPMHGRFLDAGGAPLDAGAAGADGHVADGGPFIVSDGGILDNLPVGKALDAIANSYADGTTRRELLFLEPSGINRPGPPAPAGPSQPASDPDARRSTYAVLKGAAGTRFAEETIAEDVARIEAHNAAVRRAAIARRAHFAALADRAALVQRALDERPEYRVRRSGYDADLVLALLRDPLGQLGRDDFPSRLQIEPTAGTFADAAIADREWRSPLDAHDPGARLTLAGDLAGGLSLDDTSSVPPAGAAPTIDGDGLSAVLAAGARPVIRSIRLLTEWARYVEWRTGASPTAPHPTPSELKGQLYRALAFTLEAVEHVRRLGWVAAAVRWPRGEQVGSFVDHAVTWLDGLARTDAVTAPDPGAAIATALRAADDATLGAVRDDVTGRIGQAAAGNGTELRAAIVAALVGIAEDLRQVTNAIAAIDVGTAPESLRNGWYLDRVLRGDQAIDAATLGALEVVCFDEFVSGEPGARPISFHRLSAGNPTPIAPAFRDLFADFAADPTDPRWWDPGHVGHQPTPWVGQQGIHVDLKLAGNELAHFSAFLLRRWRANDWMWGRLDAVPTLVGLLAEPAPLKAWLQSPLPPVNGSTPSDDEPGPAPGEGSSPVLDPNDGVEKLRLLIVGADAQSAALEALVWLPRASAITAAVEAIYDAEGDALAAVDLSAVRDALTAWRQWEIVTEELPLIDRDSGAGADDGPDHLSPLPPITVDQAEAELLTYVIGCETLHTPAYTKELRDRFDELTSAAGQALVANIEYARHGQALPTLIRHLLVRGVKAVGWVIDRKATTPQDD